MTRRSSHVLLFTGLITLTVLLFIAPRTKAVSDNPAESITTEKGIQGMMVFRNLATRALEPAQKLKFDRLSHNHQFDSLQEFWLQMKQPDLIALTAEEKAQRSGKSEDYFAAGGRYYNAVRFSEDNSKTPVLYQGAIRNLEAGLKQEPSNTDARIMLANCYVEGTGQPMEGIRMLKELESADSANYKVQLSLGMFAVKSGQLDKAAERFRKVLEIDSTYLESWLHLADVYERQQNVAATISSLEQYARRTNDITARIEVNKYIDQLKRKQTN